MRENDLTLLRRYTGDHSQNAFAEIVRRHMDAVYSSALRRVGGDAHLAKDVAQDVFISLARHAEALAHHQCLTGWLFTATRNAAANRIRTETRRRTREKEAAAMEEPQSRTENDLTWDRVAPFIEKAFDKLSERDRLAVLLRFFEHRTFPEIGSALEISEDGARLRVDRALEKLRVLLARNGIHSTAAVMGTTLAQYAVIAAPAGLQVAVTSTALQATPSMWEQALDIIRSFRLTDISLITAAVMAIGGAFFAGQKANDSTEKLTALRIVEQHAIAQAEQRINVLEQRRQSERRPRLKPQPPTALTPLNTPKSSQPPPSVLVAGGRRTELAANYNSFYLDLGLSTAQINQFEKIRLREPSNGGIWIFDQAAPSDVPPPLSARQIEQQLRALLGDFGYEKYRNYNRIIPAKTITTQLASTVYLTDPINREQGEQLTTILATASASYQSGGEIDAALLDWQAVLASASRLLTPTQLAALRASRQQSIFQNALHCSLNERNASSRPSSP